MIELQDEQRQELSHPAPVAIDPLTQEIYVMVRKAVYDRFRPVLEKDEARAMYRLLTKLDPEDWEVCDEFETRWKTGPQPEIEAFLARCRSADKTAMLRELVHLDVIYRRQCGQQPRPEEYFERFPQFKDPIAKVFAIAGATLQDPCEPNTANSLFLDAPRDFDDSPRTQSIGHLSSSGTRFQILRPHAKGGLGEVFVAEDVELHREVALKQIQDCHADEPECRARFLVEAEITGGLEHPGIVPVYGLGQYEDGRPYYAMRFIRGDSLQDAIKRFHAGSGSAQSTSQRTVEFRKLLGRFIDVCNAIEYAHSRGVLHRDLKPGNVMLGKHGETLVVDWGLAKPIGQSEAPPSSEERPLRVASLSDSSSTRMGSTIGTPHYMSPEQADGRLDLLGPATDVYSLGATLYTLLTGQVPFADADKHTVLKKVRSGEFPRPKQVNPTVAAGLDAICLKAMSHQIGDRYRSPAELAEDIEHWLADEPVAARRDPIHERLMRMARRNKSWTLAVATSLVAITAVSILATALVNQQRKIADEQRAAAVELAEDKERLAAAERQSRTKAEQLAEEKAELADKEKTARESAERLAAEKDQLAKSERGLRAKTQLQAAHLYFDQSLAKCEHEDATRGVLSLAESLRRAIDADAPDLERAIRMQLGAWARRVHPLKLVLDAGERIETAALSPDGQMIVTAHSKVARRWDLATGQAIDPPLAHGGTVTAITFSHDGKLLATTSKDKMARIWDAVSGELIGEPLEHAQGIRAVVFSGDGKRLLTGGDAGLGTLWDLETRQAIKIAVDTNRALVALAFSRDGKSILTAPYYGAVRRWDITVDPVRELPPLDAGLSGSCYALNGNGTRFAVGGTGGKVKILETETFKPVGGIISLPSVPSFIAFSADDTMVVTGHASGRAYLSDISSEAMIGTSLSHTGGVPWAGIPAGGKSIVTAGFDGTVRCWELDRTRFEGRSLARTRIGASTIAFDPDGKLVLTGQVDGRVHLVEAETGKARLFPAHHASMIYSVAFNRDGTQAATASGDKTARVWSVGTGEPTGEALPHSSSVTSVAFAPDGKILTACRDGKARLWDPETAQVVGPVLNHEGQIVAAKFSSDGRTVATAGAGGVRLWDATSGEEIGSPFNHAGIVKDVALSRDGRFVLTGCDDYVARLWNSSTGNLISSFVHSGTVNSVEFSPDESMIVTGDDAAHIWDLATRKAIGPPLQPLRTSVLNDVALSPDGTTIGTGWQSAVFMFWNTPQPVTGDPERILLWTQVITGMELDENLEPRVLDAGTWQERRTRLDALGGDPTSPSAPATTASENNSPASAPKGR